MPPDSFSLNFMILTKVITNKFISVLALVFIAVEAFPQLWQNPSLLFVFRTILWTVCAIFVWLKKDWAARILAFLAMLYFIGDILFEIPKFKSNILSFSNEIEGFGSYLPYVIILAMLIEVLFLLCFIYYGIFVVKPPKATS